MTLHDSEIPWIINLELTNLCQLECVFCDHPVFKKKMRLGCMEDSLVRKILSDIDRDWGDEKIHELGLVGLGEPTLDKRWSQHLEIISEYASDDATVVIGTVLDQEMEGNLRVTMVATGIRHPSQGAPDVRVIEGGRANEPEDIDYDQPTVIRRRPRQTAASGIASNVAEKLDFLDIPAFLRRQTD